MSTLATGEEWPGEGEAPVREAFQLGSGSETLEGDAPSKQPRAASAETMFSSLVSDCSLTRAAGLPHAVAAR